MCVNKRRLFLIFFTLIMLICLNACSTVRLGIIPPPPPTNKLRVMVQPISEPPRHSRLSFPLSWTTSHEEFTTATYSHIANFLEKTGIYEVVSEEDVRSVLGKQWLTGWDWEKNSWALARQVAKALYADYIMIVERGTEGSTFLFYWKMVLINSENGKQFASYDKAGELHRTNMVKIFEVIRLAYRKIFQEARADMLATAIRRGRLATQEDIKKPIPVPEKKVAVVVQPVPEKTIALPLPPSIPEKPSVSAIPVKEKAPTPAQAPVDIKRPAEIPEKKLALAPPLSVPEKPVPVKVSKPAPPPEEIKTQEPVPEKKVALVPPGLTPEKPVVSAVPAEEKTRDFEKKLEKAYTIKTDETGKARLVVYDFDSTQNLNVVALILTEALREELYLLGNFTLVNRENITNILQELQLQQSGLVDEKQAVQMGKWLGANETVTGKLGVLGNTLVLSAKRIDIKTLGILGLGSLRCTTGKEEELLDNMSVLAKRLAKTP